MKSKSIFWGMLLISIGILWILKSLGVISFSWFVFIKLWPLILVWIGIKLMPISDKWKIILNTTVLLIGIAFLLILSNSNCCNYKWNKSNYCSKNWTYICNDDDETTECLSENFIKYENIYENAHLQLSASAGKIVFATGDELISIKETENPRSNINIRSSIDDDNNVKVKAEAHPFKNNYSKGFKYHIRLNSAPVWDMDLNLNATAGQVDLSLFKIKELTIESNASSLDFKLGSLYDDVNVKVESNASAVKITIPQNMKCVLKKAENNLSSFKVKGLKKQSKDQYISDSESETTGVINITIESNVSSVEVKRY